MNKENRVGIGKNSTSLYNRAMRLNDILPDLLYQFKSDLELVQSIGEISHKFTLDRENIQDYLNDPKLVSAYAAFYGLTNIPKLESILKWLPPAWIDQLRTCDFIDLGAGPGTFSLAWKNLGGAGEFYQIESSELMRKQALKIWQSRFPDVLRQSSRWDWESKNERLLFFGHSANEMEEKVITSYIEKIKPDHILFIEPGTKSFFPKMLNIRDYLLANQFNVLYPCPKALECPMRHSDKDWCHQFIHVKQEPEIERISQMVKLDRKLLPLTVHAYSKTFSYQNPEERLVRVLPETKFSHEWEVCHNTQLEHYQVMKRDLSRQESKALSSVLAGEAIETETIKNLEQARRVKLNRIVKP